MLKHGNIKRLIHFTLLLCVAALMILVSIYLTQHVVNSESAQALVQQFGYISILIISFTIGISMILPVPAATFTPIFTAGGIHILTVIILAVTGTMLANFVSYFIGRLGNKFAVNHYPDIQKKIFALYTERKELLPYMVFGFAALIPLPDEVYLIPLGIIGVKIKDFILPLFLGVTFFQTATTFGFQNVFQFLLN